MNTSFRKCVKTWYIMHFRTQKLFLNNKKNRFFSKKFEKNSQPSYFFFYFFSKKGDSLYSTFYMIFSRFFEIFLCPDTLDFGSLWKPHRTSDRYILLVGVSLPIDQQLCQRISSLPCQFGCSDSPKLPISCKNASFAILAHFWAWPLCATF